MRWTKAVLAAMLLVPQAASFAASERPPAALCAQSGPACQASKADLKKAKSAFSRGLTLEKQNRFPEAFAEFDTAARLVPMNVDYVTAQALTRQHLVSEHVRRGNSDLEKGSQIEAQAEFRSAVTLDPGNEFAQQRLRESLGNLPMKQPSVEVEDGGELRVAPAEGKHSFHFRGDARALMTAIGQAFGVSVDFDDSVVARRVHFDIEDVDFYTAMRAAGSVTGTFWAPLAEKQIIVARDNPENHRQLDRMAMRVFRMSGATPQEINQLIGLLRMVFEIRFLQPGGRNGVFVMRAPVSTLAAATQCLESLQRPVPQVLLEIKVFQVDHRLARDIGVHIPQTFNLFSIPAAALTALGGQNIQDLINQLISGGGINQADTQGISALISQLQGQQSGIFSQPLATFGGGLTLMGLSLDTLSAQLSLNESWVQQLEHATLRAGQGADTTFRMGSRYPVVNASFAPIFNTSAISQVLQNGSFQAPIPSFSYEDLGLDVKAKPTISPDASVRLDLELRLRTLAGQSINGVPVIANREYKGGINLENGEPAVIASTISHSELRTLMGVPGFGMIPGLKRLATTENKSNEDDELLIVITPHVTDLGEKQNTEFWLAD